jgi:hypothetical protein
MAGEWGEEEFSAVMKMTGALLAGTKHTFPEQEGTTQPEQAEA